MPHREIFKNTLYQFMARVSTAAVGFIITILIARTFGVSGYGDFTKIIAVVSLLYLVVDFGLNAIFIREKEFTFQELLYSRIGIAFLLFLGLNLTVYFLPYSPVTDIGFSPEVKFGILVFSLSLFNQAIIFSTAAIFQKKLKYLYFMLSQGLGATLSLILIVIFVNFYTSISLVICAFVLGGVLSSILSLMLVKEKIGHLRLRLPKQLFIQSFPIGMMLLFNLIYFRIDVLILSSLKSTSDVGIYGLSYKVFEFLIALPLFLSNSLYPSMLKKVESKVEFRNIFKRYLLIFLVLSIVTLVIFWILAPMLTFINKDLYKAVLPFRILILGLPFFFLSSFYQWLLIVVKKQKFLMHVYFWVTILNIILNLIFIPKASYIASAIITGVCEVVILALLAWKFSQSGILPEGKEERK